MVEVESRERRSTTEHQLGCQTALSHRADSAMLPRRQLRRPSGALAELPSNSQRMLVPTVLVQRLTVPKNLFQGPDIAERRKVTRT